MDHPTILIRDGNVSRTSIQVLVSLKYGTEFVKSVIGRGHSFVPEHI